MRVGAGAQRCQLVGTRKRAGAVNAGHGQAGIYVDNTSASTNSMDWNQATIQAEYIIR
jgi:hypothetical protein